MPNCAGVLIGRSAPQMFDIPIFVHGTPVTNPPTCWHRLLDFHPLLGGTWQSLR